MPLSPVPSDIDIVHGVVPAPIREIAQSVGIIDEEIEFYGSKKAKVRNASFCV